MILNANELDWVDEQVQAIKPPRVGLNKKVLHKLKNPFVFTKVKKETKEIFPVQNTTQATNSLSVIPKQKKVHKRFYLSLIINKSAMINKKWYKEGDFIFGYKVIDIQQSSVILLKNKTRHIISTSTLNPNIIFKNK